MAMFKAPKVTTAQRNTLTLEVSELVYDVDQKAFYGGDGTTLGGFLVGETSGFIVEQVELSHKAIRKDAMAKSSGIILPALRVPFVFLG